MKNAMNKILSLLLALLLSVSLFACGAGDVPDISGQDIPPVTDNGQQDKDIVLPDEDGSYSSKEDVALYLWVYHRLPDNYITKKEAQELGWSGGSLEAYAPGCAIGGDWFRNLEGLLPKIDGITYTECDIDTLCSGEGRGAKRIVFSNDGYIYYTDDHYKSFTEIWFTEDYVLVEQPLH